MTRVIELPRHPAKGRVGVPAREAELTPSRWSSARAPYALQ